VYLALDRNTDKKVVIKFLKPVRKMKYNREIYILQHLSQGEYIIQLLDVC